MNATENLLRVIRHDHPAYVPLGLGEALREITFETVEWPEQPGFDAWEVRWDVATREIGAYPVEHPLKAMEELDQLAMPDFRSVPYQAVAREWTAQRAEQQQQDEGGNDKTCFRKRQKRGSMAPNQEFMLMGRVGETLFERAWMLTGMESLMVAFYESPGRLHESV